jgi:hypothetical protein
MFLAFHFSSADKPWAIVVALALLGIGIGVGLSVG